MRPNEVMMPQLALAIQITERHWSLAVETRVHFRDAMMNSVSGFVWTRRTSAQQQKNRGSPASEPR